MSLDKIQSEERRLAILKVLAKSPGQSGNAYVLSKSLEAIGHVSSLDQVRTELAWLKEQGLIDAEDMGEGMVVASLRQRGFDAQAGRVRIPGVAIPFPKG